MLCSKNKKTKKTTYLETVPFVDPLSADVVEGALSLTLLREDLLLSTPPLLDSAPDGNMLTFNLCKGTLVLLSAIDNSLLCPEISSRSKAGFRVPLLASVHTKQKALSFLIRAEKSFYSQNLFRTGFSVPCSGNVTRFSSVSYQCSIDQMLATFKQFI